MSDQNERYRRDVVSFDAYYFEKEKAAGRIYSVGEAFKHINRINLWGSSESASGEGSTSVETAQLKPRIQALFRELNIKTILDAGCGDFSWVETLDLSGIEYIGYDVLKESVLGLQDRYAKNNNVTFVEADISEAPLPAVELILCRDCLVHYSLDDIQRTLANFKKSGSRYLLTTTFTKTQANEDIVTGDWRTLNLELEPFCFPEPKLIIPEGCGQNDGLYQDKSLGLWEF